MFTDVINFVVQECGEMTTKGVSSLLDCKALEDLMLRHNVRFHDCFLSSGIDVYAIGIYSDNIMNACFCGAGLYRVLG